MIVLVVYMITRGNQIRPDYAPITSQLRMNQSALVKPLEVTTAVDTQPDEKVTSARNFDDAFDVGLFVAEQKKLKREWRMKHGYPYVSLDGGQTFIQRHANTKDSVIPSQYSVYPGTDLESMIMIADTGDRAAMVEVGDHYLNHGVAKGYVEGDYDFEKGVDYHREAAKRGSTYSLDQISDFYLLESNSINDPEEQIDYVVNAIAYAKVKLDKKDYSDVTRHAAIFKRLTRLISDANGDASDQTLSARVCKRAAEITSELYSETDVQSSETTKFPVATNQEYQKIIDTMSTSPLRCNR